MGRKQGANCYCFQRGEEEKEERGEEGRDYQSFLSPRSLANESQERREEEAEGNGSLSSGTRHVQTDTHTDTQYTTRVGKKQSRGLSLPASLLLLNAPALTGGALLSDARGGGVGKKLLAVRRTFGKAFGVRKNK